MTSNQMSAGSGKAQKFVAANPLGPMADPFEGMDDDSKAYHKEMSDNVNQRMQKSMDELRDKHARGTNEVDDPDRAPTGAAYREAHRVQSERARADRARAAQTELDDAAEVERIKGLRDRVRRGMFDKENGGDGTDGDGGNDGSGNGGDGNGSDSDYDDLLDDDPELEAIRARRVAEMRQSQTRHAEDMARGHGSLRTITQDEFLPECAGGSEWVAIHFYHDDFERCKVLDHHLKIVAPLHTTCKFLRIDARKAPFFVSKLQVQTLPTLIVFRDGKAVDRLTGFDKLTIDPKEPDKWHTGRLREWLAGTGAIEYEIPTEELREEMKRMGITPRGAVWSGTRGGPGGGGLRYDEEDE